MPSARAYDTRVAGAVSRQPGLVLGEPGDTKSLIAQSGRVRIKVDATYGAIKPGDLLVTSPTAGHAMRSKPMKIGGQFLHRPGTLVGKAQGFHPAARGRAIVEKFRAAAEAYGYVVAASNNSRNGEWAVSAQAVVAMSADLTRRFAIDGRRIYLTGFSGGARVATQVLSRERADDEAERRLVEEFATLEAGLRSEDGAMDSLIQLRHLLARLFKQATAEASSPERSLARRVLRVVSTGASERVQPAEYLKLLQQFRLPVAGRTGGSAFDVAPRRATPTPCIG